MAVAKFFTRLLTPNVNKLAYNASGFNQYGLMLDDICNEFDPDVKEALRRLPTNLTNERNFRIVRAVVLDTQKKVLPPEEWVQYENDVKYLQPYLEEVIKEREEREKWEADG